MKLLRALTTVGILIGIVVGQAGAQIAEEVVAMMLYGQTKPEFTDREVINVRDRAGNIGGERIVTRIKITKLGDCRFEISPRTGMTDNKFIRKDSKGSYTNQVLPNVFDFSKVSAYEVQASLRLRAVVEAFQAPALQSCIAVSARTRITFA